MTEMKLRLLLSAAILPLTFAVAAHAADVAPSAAIEPAGDGLFGRVVSADGSPLPGAEIIVRGSGRRAVSNTQGEFSLPGLTGDVVLDVRYIGLPHASQSVVLTPGRAAQVTVTLGGDDVTTVADVVVTGVITDGVARSLNQQKNADGTINVLSSDAIVLLPGSAGTLSEAQLAQRYTKPVIAYLGNTMRLPPDLQRIPLATSIDDVKQFLTTALPLLVHSP
jgi:hypothetical protein